MTIQEVKVAADAIAARVAVKEAQVVLARGVTPHRMSAIDAKQVELFRAYLAAHT